MAWPRKPPVGERCDAHTGSGCDASGKPVVYRCLSEAVESVKPTLGFPDEMWLCTACAEALSASGRVRRNPRLYPTG